MCVFVYTYANRQGQKSPLLNEISFIELWDSKRYILVFKFAIRVVIRKQWLKWHTHAALVSHRIHSKGSLSHPSSYSHWAPAFWREVWASQRPFSLVPWAMCFWERLSHYKLPLGATLAYTWPWETEGKSPQSPKALHLSARTDSSINKFFHIKAGTNSYPGWKPGWRMRMWYGHLSSSWNRCNIHGWLHRALHLLDAPHLFSQVALGGSIGFSKEISWCRCRLPARQFHSLPQGHWLGFQVHWRWGGETTFCSDNKRHEIQKKTAFFLHLKTSFGLVDDTKLVIWTVVLPSLYDLLATIR